MPKLITQYRVFIGSPGGLDDERKKFRHVLEVCSAHHGREKDVMFHPVGWELYNATKIRNIALFFKRSWIPERSATGLREADLDVFAKLFKCPSGEILNPMNHL